MKILLCFAVLFLSIKTSYLSSAYGPLNNDQSLEDSKQESNIAGCSPKTLKSIQKSQFYIFCKTNNLPLENIPSELMNINEWEAYVFETENKKYILPVLSMDTKKENYFGCIMRNTSIKKFIQKHCIRVEALSESDRTFFTLNLWHQLWYQRVSKELV